jgi:hypothetical protein
MDMSSLSLDDLDFLNQLAIDHAALVKQLGMQHLALLKALRDALEAGDDHRALELARQVCGLQQAA